MQKEPIDNLTNSKEVRSKYQVYGHFYEMDMGRSEVYGCRSVVEIVTVNKSGDRLTDELPDAVVIMMNPGSSSPAEEIASQVYNKDTIGGMRPTLCKAKPDPTQDQIMRLMDEMNWEHVRVINVSDLRDGDSGKFCELIGKIDCDLHSIFSQCRKEELKVRLKRKSKAPIICAWGVGADHALDKLRQKAEKALSGYQVVGLRKEKSKDSFRYYHPKPQTRDEQLKWLNKMVRQLRCRCEVGALAVATK